MNIHSTANKNKEVESVSTRVKNTKKEIEQLKSELEKLINLGAQPTYTKSTSEAAQPEIINSVTVTVDANRREPQIKKNVPEQPKKVAPVAPKKLEPAAANTSPGKKTRNYNVAEARDYIKKQREKRAEQLKAQINVADNQVDLKKQKLKELHQKTLELVTKNVQLKRERSKSRDKVAPVRLDKANPRQENVSKSRQNVVSKSRERSKQTAPSVRAKSQERTKPQNNERVSRARTRGPPAETVATGAEKIDTNLLYPPVVAPRVDDFEKTVFVPDTAKDEPVDLNKRITSEPPQKQVLEHSIMTDACLKDTKETQTSRRNEFAGAEWMRPPPALSYPYNFINTVKRKLQCAINSPRSCVDVGVQNSVGTPPASAAKSREEIRQLLIKSTHSDLRSFASHRAPNLDLEAVENLELKNPKRLDLVSKNLFTNYDSESDTSKNIPEISSESLGSNESKRLLSLDKLKDLKLQMLKKSSQSSVKSDGEESDSYSSDFQKESIRTSTIRTVTGEKLAPGELSGGNSVTNSTGNNYQVPRESDSKHGEVPSGAVKSQRGDGDSQRTFKSLLTEGQVSKSTTGSIQEMLNSRSVGDSLVLKEPSVVLSLRRDQKSQDLENNRGNNMRVGSSSGSSSESTARSREHSQGTFKSLLTEGKVSKSSGASISERVDTKDTADGSLRLKPPTLSLSVGREEKVTHLSKSKMKNITIRPAVSNNNNVNEIHLKFEAEVRLLNDFNESFKQFVAVEKAFENLKSKNETNLSMTKILQNVDTQTSAVAKTSTEKSPRTSSINFSRGSEIIEEMNDSIVHNRNSTKSLQNSTFSTDWNLSNFNESSNTNVSTEEDRSKFSVSNVENYNVNNCAGVLSLNIVDQLIKDEDAKIQQLKAIIKIREQALLDRTKVELVWLEIQKKQLIETGKIEEASLLKKKQRGIILKHEQERNEIKKLKQMQKEASEQRKNTLKHQRNLIKMQLSTDNMLSKIAVKKPKERRSMGPLRVVQSCSESIHSETSISLKSSGIEDVLSITSRSVRVSESSDLSRRDKDKVPVSNVKRTLLMREAALQKRRKTAEELLRWHRKLLDEERKIAELEAAAKSVIKRAPAARDGPDRFDGRQLNLLWRSMTGSEERKFVEDKVYVMSQMGLERLCKSAMQYSSKNKRQHAKIGDPEHSAISEGERSTVRSASDDVNYSSVFEQDSVQEIITSQQEKTKISSISELIDNFTRIGDEISTLSKKSELGITSLKEVEDDPDKSSQSVVEITTPNHEETDQSEIKTSVEEEEEVVEDEPSVVEIVSSPKEDVEESTDEKDGEEVTTSNICTAIEDQEEPVWETLEKQISFSVEDQEESSAKRLDEAIVASIRDEEESVSSPAEDREESSVEDEEKSVSEKLTEKQISAETEDQEKVSASVEVEEKSISSVLVKDGEETSVRLSDEQLATDEAAVEDEEETSCGKSDQQISTIEESDGLSSGKSSRDQVEDQKEATIEEVSAKSENLEGLVTEEISSVAPEDAAESSEKSSAEQIAGGESTSRSVEPITTDSKKQKTVESSSSVDLAKESLSLDEALESASKIEDSLSKLNEKLSSEKKDEEVETSRSESSSTEAEEKTPQKKSPNQIDVKKRVSEILADASLNRGDKSPRLQDLYVTTYDVGASNSPEFSEPFEEGRPLPTSIFGSEAEELRRKQLAIEQEIKQLELQQKEQLPYVFMREIPNKPPPPYTPPSSLTSLPQSILPTDVKEITEIASYSSKVLYKAHQNNNLDKVKFSENGFKLFSKVEVSKICAEYVFNVCRDVAREHYRQFETVAEPSWLVLAKRPQLAKAKPSDAASLERILNNKLKEVFGFKRVQVAESAIIKWGQKKRDHVDEVLVMESQEEESQWTNFDKDELIVKNQITNDIVKMLLDETAGVFAKILAKKKSVVG